MNRYLRSRCFLAQAYDWKREREVRLQAEVQILETLLETARQELADMRELEGEKLAHVYASLSARDMQEGMRESRNFAANLERIWELGEHNLKKNKSAVA